MRWALWVSFCCVALGCRPAASSAHAPSPTTGRSLTAPPSADADQQHDAVLSVMPIVSVPNDTFGPYRTLDAAGGLVAYAAVQGNQRRWWTIALNAAGTPQGEPQPIATADESLGLVALERVAGDHFVLLSSQRRADALRIESLTLDASGKAVAEPRELYSGADDPIWVDLVAADAFTLALWATRSKQYANIYAVSLDVQGQPTGPAKVVASDVLAWQSEGLSNQVALTLVADPKGDRGSVRVVFLDAQATISKRVMLHEAATAMPDVDMTRSGGELIVVWTDTTQLDPAVWGARIDAQGDIQRAAGPLLTPLGPRALVSIVGSREQPGSYLAFEQIETQPLQRRTLHVKALDTQLRPSTAEALLTFAGPDGQIPEMVVSATGLVALTAAASCPRDQPACDQPPQPTLVKLNQELEPEYSEPLRVAAGDFADLAWSLACPRGQACSALAAQEKIPAPVYAISVQRGSAAYAPAAQRRVPSAPPRLTSVSAIDRTSPLAAVAATAVSGGKLVAWLTDFDAATPYERRKTPAADGRYAPLRAHLQLQLLGADAASKPKTVSYRARSLAGVALAASNTGKEALVAWAALDRMKPQLFVTLVDASGNRRAQRMLTRSGGEISDLAAIAVGDEFVVAWIDSRNDRPEVYAIRLDRQLRTKAAERRVSAEGANVSGIALLLVKERLLMLLADARDKQNAYADLYAQWLAPKDLTPTGLRQLTTGSLSAVSPALALRGDQPVAAWVENEPALLREASGQLVLAELSDDLALSGQESVQSAGMVPTSCGIECTAGDCRIAFVVRRSEVKQLALARWSGADKPVFNTVYDLAPTVDALARPAVVLGDVVFADQDFESNGLLRAATPAWVEAD